jgi:hypothetical protein
MERSGDAIEVLESNETAPPLSKSSVTSWSRFDAPFRSTEDMDHLSSGLVPQRLFQTYADR